MRDDRGGETALETRPLLGMESLRAPLVAETVRSCVPWPAVWFVIIVALVAYIAWAQASVSFALEYDESYVVDAVVSSLSYTDEVSSSESGAKYDYDLWVGVHNLWRDGAKALAVVVGLWSGAWPHLKLLILAAGLWRYRGSVLPARFEWLSTIAHWSFVDVWMVLCVCAIGRFDYDGESSASVEGLLKIHVYLDLWFEAVAKAGVYHFFVAIALSQALGFACIRHARRAAAPPDRWALGACWSLAAAVGERYGDGERPRAVALARAAAVGAALPLFWAATRVGAIAATIVFDVSEEVDESYLDGLYTIDKTFSFYEKTQSRFSIASLIDASADAGGRSAELARVASALVVALPLARAAATLALWLAPLPRAGHELARTLHDALQLYANHDVFALAVAVVALELPVVFGASLPSADAGDLTLRSRILPGYWVYVAAVAYECLVAAVVGWLHADELARRDAGGGDGDEAARAKIGAQQGALRYHSTTATSGPGSYPSWVNSDNDSSSFT